MTGKTKLFIKRCGNHELLCKRFRANAIRPYVVCFSFFIFLLASLAFALPLQTPIAGTYQCFVAGDNPYNSNVQDAGAVLTLQGFNYTLTTATATETGTFITREIVSIAGGELEFYFQSGTEISLTPQSGSASYGGMFLVDSLGGAYTFIRNSGGVWIRCQGEGAELFNILQSADSLSPLPDEELYSIPVTPEDELLPATTKAPSPPVGAGGLSGLYYYEDKDGEYVPTFANNVASGYFEFHSEYVYFMPNGYVYRGTYNWSYEALDCSRVRKGNYPLCETYVVTGDTINFGGYSSSFTKIGNNLLIDGKHFMYQAPVDGLRFDGRFLFAAFDGYTLDEAYYTFSKDGTFKVESSSSNNATALVGGTTTYSSSYSETPVTIGAYAVRNNTIEFIYADGTSVKRVFHFEANAAGQVEYIYINGTVYSRE